MRNKGYILANIAECGVKAGTTGMKHSEESKQKMSEYWKQYYNENPSPKKGIEDPFKWSRDVVSKLQINGTGTYYSPNKTRTPGLTSENNTISAVQVDTMDILFDALGKEYAQYIEDFITNMQIIFPEMGDDFGIYMPEVKYLSHEPLVDYKNLALVDYPNVHFVGDALSARGITVAGSQGIYVASSILENP